METALNEKDSLHLINEMISTSRNNLQKGMGKIFLLWGYLVFVTSLLNLILLVFLPDPVRHNSYFIWCLMALGYPFHYRLVKKMQQEKLITTYVDKIMNYVWIAFLVSILVVVIGMIGSSIFFTSDIIQAEKEFESIRWFQWTLLPPFMLLLYGFALFISGKGYDFKPLIRGGIICWVASLLLLVGTHFRYIPEIQQVMLAVSSLFGFIIPGNLLDNKEKKNVQRS